MTGRSPSNELTNGSDTVHSTGNPAAALSITQGSLPTDSPSPTRATAPRRSPARPIPIRSAPVTIEAKNLAGTDTQDIILTLEPTSHTVGYYGVLLG